MLEYNFTQLDDDFITFWAKYLTSKEGVDFHKELQYLAKKGQINAVQNWYLYNTVGEDPEIDKIVEGYNCNNFNELYAAANYFFMRDDLYKQFCELSEQYTDLNDLLYYDDDEDNEDDEEFEEYEDIDKDEVKKDLELVKNKIHNMPHVKIIKQAYKKAIEYANNNKNIIAYATANEIFDCYCMQMLPVYEDTDNINKKIIKNALNIIKILTSEYKKNLEANKDFKPTTDPVLSFTLATTILTYKKEGEDAGLAYYLLEELADREYNTKRKYEFGI